MLVKYSELLGKVKQQQTWVLLYNSFQNSNENMLIDYMKNERLNIWIKSQIHYDEMPSCSLIETYRYFETSSLNSRMLENVR